MIKSKILKHFQVAGIEIDDLRAQLFVAYYNLIIANNEDNDLTRIKGEDNFIIKHFVDSVYYTKFFKLPQSLVDIGTGAGFPGIPLKIMFPHLTLILAEQRKKRVEFLKLAVKELGLTDVDFYPHKVTNKTFLQVDGVITRALEDAPETLLRVEHFLPEGGKVILLKGPDAQGDLNNLTNRNKILYSIETNINYTLPRTDYMRKLLVFKKESDSFSKIYSIMKDEDETRGIAVTSEDNKTFKELRKLITGDGIKKSETITVSGKKIISDYLAMHSPLVRKIILPDGYIEKDFEFDKIIDNFKKKGALYIFKKGLFNSVDLLGNRSPILITEMPKIETWDGTFLEGCNPVIPFQDPANIGAAVRSAVAFGVKRVILLKSAANPYHPKSIRSSSGAVFEMKFVIGPSISEFQPPVGAIPTFALDKRGNNLTNLDIPKTFVLIPGVEGPGIPDSLRAERVSIPVEDNVESLNATVAFSIFLYEWKRGYKK